MTTLTQLLRLPALAALLAFSACGGGDSAPTPTTPQTITFTSPGAQVYATAPVALVATSTSGLTVTFASTTPTICTVSNAALTLVTVGTCTVTASQPGDGTFVAATPVTNSFAVTAAPQTITFVSPGNQALAAVTEPLMAVSTSGLAVAFASTTQGVCTVSGTALTLVAVGTCSIDATQAGTANYQAAPTVSQSFEVAAEFAAQTITFASPGNQVMGTAPPALAATASSGLAVSFSSITPTFCTVSGTTLTLVAFGTCSVVASQAGNAAFAAAPAVTNTFDVAAIVQTINFTSPGDQTLGSVPAALLASATSGLPVQLVSGTPGVCGVNGTTLSLLAVGTCTVTASQPGNTTYSAATPVANSFAVAAAPQTISFTSPGNQLLTTATVPLTATSSSGLAVTLASSTQSVCMLSGTTLTLVAEGNCTVSASQPGNAIFAAAATVSNTFTVAKATQTITFVAPAAQAFGAAPFALVATSSSGLAVSFASTTASVCSVLNGTVTLLGAGSCVVDATQAGNGSYAAALPVTRTFLITASAQTISFVSPGNQSFGSAPLVLLPTASSGLPVTLATATPTVCTLSGTTLTLAAAGVCTVNASQAGNANFAAAPAASITFTITAAVQTIGFAALPGRTFGDAPVALAATASSGLAVSFAAGPSGVCTVSGTTLTLVGGGTCTVTASQGGNSNFAAAAAVVNAFNVAAAAQTISFTAPATQTFGSAPPALSATSTSGLTVTFTSTTTGVCTVSGTTLTLVGAGQCTISATQSGNTNYAAATPVQGSFTVAVASQSIAFTAPGNQVFGSGPIALTATSTSGLPVSFTSLTTGVCTISNTATLNLVGAGTCTVNASQGGNANYAAAATVPGSFTVAPGGQAITLTSPGSQTLATSTVTFPAFSSSGLPLSFTADTPTVCTVSGSTSSTLTMALVSTGNCSVTASQGGGGNFAPAAPVQVTFAVAAVPLLPQTITFAAPGDQAVGTTPSLVATAAPSGLTVSFAASPSTVCSVSGTTLTLVAAGTCTVTASQAGNGTYAAAADVVQPIVVYIELFGNGGFEAVGTTTPANAWLAAAGGYTRSTDARTGGFAAQLMSPALNAAIALQNSVEQGNRPPLVVGTSPVLTFWAKGTPGATGDVTYALRYLDGTGVIKANSMSRSFSTAINVNTWTKITFNLGVVPAGSVAAFIEFSQAIGPIGTGPAGENWFAGKVLIDDVSLRVP
jgi:hypothetical protein